MAGSENKYFSTKFTVKMLGARYIPSGCYPIDDLIRPTIESLAEKGEVRLYPEKVRFVSGKAIPMKKEEKRTRETPETVNITGDKNSKKRGKKDFE